MSEESRRNISIAQRGELGNNAQLTEQQVLQILYKYATGERANIDLGAEYGVSVGTISKITRRESWVDVYDSLPSHIKEKIIHQRTIGYRKKSKYRKLTDEQVIEIRRLHKETDLNFTQIAEMFPVKKSCVRNVCRGITWTSI